jgi:hypothetical protein
MDIAALPFNRLLGIEEWFVSRTGESPPQMPQRSDRGRGPVVLDSVRQESPI